MLIFHDIATTFHFAERIHFKGVFLSRLIRKIMAVRTDIAHPKKNVISLKTTMKITVVAKNVQVTSLSLEFFFLCVCVYVCLCVTD